MKPNAIRIIGSGVTSPIVRYGSRDAYVERVKAANEALLAERLLLPEDAAQCVKAAKACDPF
jgi:hypothetical protein